MKQLGTDTALNAFRRRILMDLSDSPRLREENGHLIYFGNAYMDFPEPLDLGAIKELGGAKRVEFNGELIARQSRNGEWRFF